MHVQFKIHGSGKTLAADGMAFWYTRTKMVPGSVFGSKDEFEGLGVFLDTYKNGNQPVRFCSTLCHTIIFYVVYLLKSVLLT